MKEIKLTQGKIAIIDDEDYDRVIAMGKWYFHHSGYAARSEHYKKPCGKDAVIHIRMHRVLFDIPKNMLIDHINGNRLDNRKCNLRICTPSGNARNAAVNKNSSSGFKGVTFFKKQSKFRARIAVDGKQIFLGYFDNPTEAASAYNFAAIKYHQEFAKLNQL